MINTRLATKLACLLAALFVCVVESSVSQGAILVSGRNATGGAYFRFTDAGVEIDQSSPSQGNIGFFGIDYDSSGNVFVAIDFGQHDVIRYDANTDTKLSNLPINVSSQRDLVVATDGSFFLTTSGAVRHYNAAGTFLSASSTSGLSGNVVGLDFGSDGFLYASTTQKLIYRINTANGAATQFVNDSVNLKNLIGDIAWGADGKLYVAQNEQIVRYTSTGVFDGVYSSGPILNSVQGLAFGAGGTLYAATPNDVITIDSNGNATSLVHRSTDTSRHSFTFLSYVPDAPPFQPVPEPASIAIWGIGAMCCFGLRKRFCKAVS